MKNKNKEHDVYYEIHINGSRAHTLRNYNKAMTEAYQCINVGIVDMYRVDGSLRQHVVTLQHKPDKDL